MHPGAVAMAPPGGTAHWGWIPGERSGGERGEAQEGFALLKVAVPALLEYWPQASKRPISVWPLADPPLAWEVLT